MRISERTGALLLAVRRAPQELLEPNPAGDLVVPAGAVLIALGSPELDALAAGRRQLTRTRGGRSRDASSGHIASPADLGATRSPPPAVVCT